MKRKFVAATIAVASMFAIAVPFLPSGGSQHYTAKLLEQAATAAGRLTGGGSGNAGFVSGTEVTNPTNPAPEPTEGSIDMEAALLPPVVRDYSIACITIRDATGATSDQGCTRKPQSGNMVDLLLTEGSISFTANSAFYFGGTLTATIALTGVGGYTPGIDPDILLEFDERDFMLGLSVFLSRGAVAVGSITSTSVSDGGDLIDGTGKMTRAIKAEAELCDGFCVED